MRLQHVVRSVVFCKLWRHAEHIVVARAGDARAAERVEALVAARFVRAVAARWLVQCRAAQGGA